MNPARLLALALALLPAALPAAEKKAAPPPAAADVAAPLTDEQRATLRALDARIAGLEALVAKVDDPAQRKSADTAVADMKKRRVALEKNFDPMTSETLMHSIISRYQVTALWLTPAPVPPPAGKAEKKP